MESSVNEGVVSAKEFAPSPRHDLAGPLGPLGPRALAARRGGLSLQERCARVEMLLLDVDGVLTDGRIIYANNGEELKAFHVRDGAGLKIWRKAGKRAGVITGRSSQLVARRAAELGLDVVVQGAEEKRPAFEQILKAQDLRAEQVAYVGDDLPDLPVLNACGLAATVPGACREVIRRAHYVTRLEGGQGAAREIIELLLHAQGLWDKVVERFLV